MTEKEREETVAGIEDDLKKLEQSATTDFDKGVAEGFRRAESILISAAAYNVANHGKAAELWGDHLYEAAEMISEGATDSYIMYQSAVDAYKNGYKDALDKKTT